MSQDTKNGHGIKVVDVTKTYPSTASPAVADVSLDVAPGEFMTLLGPSGSGKTTTLSVLAGFVSPTAGRIEIDGRDVTRAKPHRRDLGVVFQQYALFPHMTVAKNVAFPLQQRRLGRAEIAAKLADVLRLVHLEEHADRLPRQLSGGQQQRVALARAVVYQPRALLLDEPLGALDKRLRDELQREIARMHRELGMTFVFVTHDQQEAITLSDRIALFNEGRVEQVGTPAELYEQPRTLFAAQFLGESNRFRGRADHGAGTVGCEGYALRAPAFHADLHAARAVVVVRPERLRLHAGDGDVPPSYNQLSATVTSVVYVGDHHQVGLRYADGTEGSAMLLAGSPLPATPGESVTVSWDPEHQAVVTDGTESPDAAATPVTAGT